MNTASDERTGSLTTRYPGLVCDLDGVVYRGARAVPHAVQSLAAARAAGVGIVYATNNASRPPAVVADSLREFGISLADGDVLTSSLAGAQYLAIALDAAAPVLAIGGSGVAEALEAVGLRPIASSDASAGPVDAVLQGYGPNVTAGQLAEAAYAIQGGARWIATNDDRTLPTDRGVAPGNGSLVAAVRSAVAVSPTVVGKPGPMLYELAAQALGTDKDNTLGIGDRLETDVAGAHAAGMSALHVLTGVHGPSDLVEAPPELRPRYIGLDLRALLEPYAEPERVAAGSWTDGQTVGTLVREGNSVRIRYDDAARSSGGSPWIARLRLALVILWEALDGGRLRPDEAVAALPVQQ